MPLLGSARQGCGKPAAQPRRPATVGASRWPHGAVTPCLRIPQPISATRADTRWQRAARRAAVRQRRQPATIRLLASAQLGAELLLVLLSWLAGIRHVLVVRDLGSVRRDVDEVVLLHPVAEALPGRHADAARLRSAGGDELQREGHAVLQELRLVLRDLL